jgi:hypothetical protein
MDTERELRLLQDLAVEIVGTWRQSRHPALQTIVEHLSVLLRGKR